MAKLYASMTFGVLLLSCVLFAGSDWLAFILRVTVCGPNEFH